MISNDQKRLSEMAQSIFDKKGMNIIGLDVRGVSSCTDYFIIAEGNVEKHVTSIAKALHDLEVSAGLPPLRVEGMQKGDWIVMDFGYIIVHLFTPDMREKYRIESLWSKGKIVDLKINVSKESFSWQQREE